MRTNIDLDETLMTEALTLTGLHTKREVVHLALTELIRLRRKKDLADLAGRVRFVDGFDHKAMRSLRRGDR